MHAVFGTAKPRAGGGVSARKAIVPSSNEPRRSARLKTAASQIGSTNQALQKSSSSCSKNSSANDESSLKTRSPSKLASTGTPYSPLEFISGIETSVTLTHSLSKEEV